MSKTYLCIIISFFMSISAYAAAAESDKAGTTEVSVGCAISIEMINQDVPRLYFFMEGIFAGLGELEPKATPSFALDLVTKGMKQAIDESVKTQYMPASEYVSQFLVSQGEKLDQVFGGLLKENDNNVQAAWKAFGPYFQQECLVPTFVNYKRSLVKIDQEARAQSYTGIIELAE